MNKFSLRYTEHNESTVKSPIAGKYYLQHINSTIHDFEKCRKSYQSKEGVYIERENLRFCVSLRNGRGNSNSGDSGSPVLTPDKKFLGLHSVSVPSKKLPEIGVSIPAYMDFVFNPRVCIEVL